MSVPVLMVVPVLAVTEYPTIPLPVPLLPEVIVIHEALLVAVHEQLLDEGVTVTLPVPADEVKDREVGEMV